MANSKFNNDLLIDQATGEIRQDFVRRAAAARAKFKYGPDCTQSDIDFMVERCTAIAQGLRANRRRDLGLPPEPCTTIFPFGRQVDGVRYSAF